MSFDQVLQITSLCVGGGSRICLSEWGFKLEPHFYVVAYCFPLLTADVASACKPESQPGSRLTNLSHLLSALRPV